MREQFKRDNPGMTFGQLAKYTSHMYKNLTPQEKSNWDTRAAQDKARYETEIAAYIPPPGHDARGILIDDHRPRKRNKRGPKDPAAPKRASGAYVFFTNEMRPKVLTEYPGIKFVELGKVMGERWRALTPEAKKKYEEMAAQDKLRFQMEMSQYSANQAAAAAAAAPPVPPQPPHLSAVAVAQQQVHHPQYNYTPAATHTGYEAYVPDPYVHQQAQYHQA